MTSEETQRVTLRELLIDTVPLPAESVREAIFERTFAAGQEPGGADLVPPPELFGGVAETPIAEGHRLHDVLGALEAGCDAFETIVHGMRSLATERAEGERS
ncbi:MAG: hypothetical protein ACRDTF_24145 [Pseudonocardiaceae bacterium]